jgi:hypothetical protein
MRWILAPLLAACGLASCLSGEPTDEAIGHSASAISSPLPAVPCAARAEAIIANGGGVVFSNSASLVDSYQSSLGPYGGANVGSNGTVQAATSIVMNGGIIHGTKLQNSPAGLTLVPVPSGARALPLGSTAPGSLNINGVSDSITLTPGTYVATNVNVNFPGAISIFPPGLVSIFVTGNLNLGGNENLNGSPANMQFVVTSSGNVNVNSRGTFVGLLYAPTSAVNLSSTVFGSVVGSTVTLNSGSSVHFDASSVCPPPAPSSPAVPPAPLPAPPPPIVGCYVNTLNGWQSTPCATEAFMQANFPHPDSQLGLTSSSSAPLVFGQVAVTVPEVTSNTDEFIETGISVCPDSGTSEPNQWSVQTNTNDWVIASGPNAGHTATTQFTIQANGSTSAVCIWNIDVTAQAYFGPNNLKCVVPAPIQRPGGLQPFDSGNIAGFVNSNGTLSVVAQFSWVPAGQPNQYATVFEDTYGLAANWSQVGGGLIGLGNCFQEQFTQTELVTQVLASTCPGDTLASSPVCAPPVLQPNVSVFTGALGTAETNNLTATGSASLSYLNSDLAVTNITSTTSGSCLGPSHAYVKDNALDFGATPSNLGGQVFWESPDIFLVPSGSPVSVNGVSTETAITPGGSFDVWVRVHNDLGCSDTTNVKTLVYLADPSLLSAEWVPITTTNGGQATYLGDNLSTTGITVTAGTENLIGPIPFTAPTTGIGDGHKCILAAIEADGEGPITGTASTDAPDSNQIAQRNLQFVGTCEYPLTNATTSSGSVQLTLTVTPDTGTPPSLTALPDVGVTFDDADSTWFNAWSSQAAGEAQPTFQVTHDATANTTTVRLGTFSIVLNPVTLAAGASRNATGNFNLASGGASATLQITAVLTEAGPTGTVTVMNGGSCALTPPPIIAPPK